MNSRAAAVEPVTALTHRPTTPMRRWILAERLATCTTNPYRNDPVELAETLQCRQTVEPLFRASATLEVITTVPVARVADIVLNHVL